MLVLALEVTLISSMGHCIMDMDLQEVSAGIFIVATHLFRYFAIM